LADWLKKYPKKGAKEAKKKLEGDFWIKLRYSKAWSGMKVALERIMVNMRKVLECCTIGRPK